jgi:hypothetical protein
MSRLNKARMPFLEADEALHRYVAREVKTVWKAKFEDPRLPLPARVLGRKNSYGHQAAWSGELSALIRSIQTTGKLHRLDPLCYLTEYFTACGGTGGKPLEGLELDRFLSWSMSEEQRRAWAALGAQDPS